MKLPCHVVIFGPSDKFLSGISYYTIRLSNALAEQNKVTALLFRNMLPRKFFPGWKRVGSPLTTLQFADRVEVSVLLDWYNPLTWLAAYRRSRKGDVLLFEWWTSSVGFMYFFIAFLNLKRIPLIIEFHEVVDPIEEKNLFLRWYSRSIGWLIRKLASHFVVHSESDRSLVAASYRIPMDQLTVIPHGLYDQYQKIDATEARARLGIREDFVILFFGLLRPYKGLRYLIQAFESLPPDILEQSHLLVAGEPWEDQESVRLIEESPEGNHITLLGRYVDDNEISMIFSAANVLVLPYTRASQSGVAHIAMSFGLPIIASDIGAFIESLGKYKGCIFVKSENTNDLSEALQDVMKDNKRYPPPDDLQWDVISKRWMDFLKQILEEKRRNTEAQ
jgi:glycosyltransferase involved in cell wall biosynthesis